MNLPRVFIIALLALSVGSCKKEGCTDETADNFDPKAKKDDGTCVISGCKDKTMINYDETATFDCCCQKGRDVRFELKSDDDCDVVLSIQNRTDYFLQATWSPNMQLDSIMKDTVWSWKSDLIDFWATPDSGGWTEISIYINDTLKIQLAGTGMVTLESIKIN